MFKKNLLSAIFIWLCVVLVGGGLLYTSSSDAHLVYQRLINDSNQAKKERLQEEAQLTQQRRQQVSKQILYYKEKERLQARLTSAESDLIYSKKGGELSEHFKGLSCVMQEELINPSKNQEAEAVTTSEPQQVVRQLVAQEGVYSYRNGILEAKGVEVANYTLPGHLYPDSLTHSRPFIHGRAEHLQLDLLKEPMMQAQEFQVILQDGEKYW